MEEKIKDFQIVDGKLRVEVSATNDVIIPIDGNRETIGTYTQTTVQSIDKKHIPKLKKFIEDEEDKAKKQLENIEAQLAPLKDIESIDEDIIKHARQAIGKGTKEFKKSMQQLNKRIADLDQKKGLEAQVEYIKNMLDEVQTDLKKLNAALK